MYFKSEKEILISFFFFFRRKLNSIKRKTQPESANKIETMGGENSLSYVWFAVVWSFDV